MTALIHHQADVSYHDPHVPTVRVNGSRLESVPLEPETLEQADCVVIITVYSAFDWEVINQHCRLIVDTRNALGFKPNGHARVVRLKW